MSQALLDTLLATPFVSRIGVRIEQKGTELTGVLPFTDQLIGNPLIPALHGGAVGAFMEVVASASLLVSQPMARLPRPIDVAIDYLRPARAQDVYALSLIHI